MGPAPPPARPHAAMTLIRKVNKKGRSTSQFKTNKRMKIGAIFVPHTVEMLESPAWCVLSVSARRVLDRIELEHMYHGKPKMANCR